MHIHRVLEWPKTSRQDSSSCIANGLASGKAEAVVRLERIVVSNVIYLDIGCPMSDRRKTLTQAAKEIGVSSVTLRRWLLTQKVGEVGRDRNGWRVFSDDDIARIRAYATKVTPPEEK